MVILSFCTPLPPPPHRLLHYDLLNLQILSLWLAVSLTGPLIALASLPVSKESTVPFTDLTFWRWVPAGGPTRTVRGLFQVGIMTQVTSVRNAQLFVMNFWMSSRRTLNRWRVLTGRQKWFWKHSHVKRNWLQSILKRQNMQIIIMIRLGRRMTSILTIFCSSSSKQKRGWLCRCQFEQMIWRFFYR